MTIVAGTVCMFLHWYFGVLKLSGTSDVQEMQLGGQPCQARDFYFYGRTKVALRKVNVTIPELLYLLLYDRQVLVCGRCINMDCGSLTFMLAS